LLFFEEKIVFGQVIEDVKYLEIKYLEDVVYTPAQKEITNNLPATVIEKNITIIKDINNIEVVPVGTDFTIKEVKKVHC